MLGHVLAALLATAQQDRYRSRSPVPEQCSRQPRRRLPRQGRPPLRPPRRQRPRSGSPCTRAPSPWRHTTPAGASAIYIFGSGAPYTDLVAYYRTVLKQKGEIIFKVPATHQFEVGKYREETMAFPPGVTVKDFQSAVSEGYPNPKPGGQPAVSVR